MEMSGTTVIKKPVDTVFDYVRDVAHDANWRTGVTESGLRDSDVIEPGVIGYTRAGNTEAEWRVTAYSAGEHISWDLISGPYRGKGGYRLEPVDGGTQFTLVADIEPSGLFKLLGPVFGWIGRRQNQADVEKLRDILEAM